MLESAKEIEDYVINNRATSKRVAFEDKEFVSKKEDEKLKIKNSITSSIELRTPTRLSHNNESPSTIKNALENTKIKNVALPSISEHTEIKVKPDLRIIMAEQGETETRKYYKLKESTQSKGSMTKNSCKKSNYSGNGPSISQRSFSSQNLNKEDSNSLENTTQKSIKLSQKRRCQIFSGTQLYVPSKRIKKDQNFVKENIQLYDKLRKSYLEFRVFKEADLGHNRVIQSTLKESKVDDDCPTDSEQMELATKHVQKQLRQALEMQKSFDVQQQHIISSSSRYSSNESSSQDLPSFGPYRNYKDDENEQSSEVSQYIGSTSKVFKKVVKKLSYSKVKDDSSKIVKSSNFSKSSTN